MTGWLAIAGCAPQPTANRPEPAFADVPGTTNAVSPHPSLIVTPGTGLTGKVTRVNSSGRFVVMTFPIGHLPTLDQPLSIYRQGLKVGELKVTGPQRDDSVVADLVAGDAAPGDEVRDK